MVKLTSKSTFSNLSSFQVEFERVVKWVMRSKIISEVNLNMVYGDLMWRSLHILYRIVWRCSYCSGTRDWWSFHGTLYALYRYRSGCRAMWMNHREEPPPPRSTSWGAACRFAVSSFALSIQTSIHWLTPTLQLYIGAFEMMLKAHVEHKWFLFTLFWHFCVMSTFQNPLVHSDFNMFVDEVVNDSTNFCFTFIPF